MTIIFQSWIKREDLKNNKRILFLFGDNLERKGLGGQAKEMRGEPNAIGIATKKSPTRDENAYFTDEEFENNANQIDLDFIPVFEHVKNGGIVICPADGLGTGLSKLPEKAPKTNEYIRQKIITLKNIALNTNQCNNKNFKNNNLKV
jgi:hypothetical protein